MTLLTISCKGIDNSFEKDITSFLLQNYPRNTVAAAFNLPFPFFKNRKSIIGLSAGFVAHISINII